MENRWLDFSLSFCYRSELAEAKCGSYSLRIHEDAKAEVDNNESCVGTEMRY